MAIPKLFYEDPQTILDRMIANYSGKVGRAILPSQPEYLFYATIAYEFVLQNAKEDEATMQMLVAGSTGPMIDYLAQLVSVERLDSQPSVTKLQFTLTPGHSPLTIPAGTRAKTQDGQYTFATDQETAVGSGVDVVVIDATCTVNGSASNGIPPGQVIEIVDVQAFVSGVTNTVTTAGGSEVETDDGLRERIKIALNQISTAGSKKSYRYWAMSTNPLIKDVKVLNDGGANVNIYPLISGGVETPQAILDAVFAATNGDERRPVNDIVTVISPDRIEYDLPVSIILKYGVVQSTAVDAVTDALSAYCIAKADKLGEDITVSQLNKAAMNDDIHSLSFGAFTGLAVGETEFAVCTQISITSVTYETL